MKLIRKIICCSVASCMLYACKKADNIVKNTNVVTDVDGNTYHIITIGNQQWLQENLQTTRYSDKTPINYLPDQMHWSKDTLGAWCNYDNNADTGKLVGKLYNWYAVNNEHGLCPKGFKIPDTADFRILINQLGGMDAAGQHLTNDNPFWMSSNMNRDNSSGFTALPAGGRGTIDCNGFGSHAAFWSSTQPIRPLSDYHAYAFGLSSNSLKVEIKDQNVISGYSCRCIKSN